MWHISHGYKLKDSDSFDMSIILRLNYRFNALLIKIPKKLERNSLFWCKELTISKANLKNKEDGEPTLTIIKTSWNIQLLRLSIGTRTNN
jgi:hypothetical protein